jgi:hypothetical protein
MYAQARSMNMSLHEGTTDGTWKKANMNWCNASDLTAQVRSNMSGVWHGFNEVNPKITPDGISVSTPGYYDIEPIDNENV